MCCQQKETISKFETKVYLTWLRPTPNADSLVQIVCTQHVEIWIPHWWGSINIFLSENGSIDRCCTEQTWNQQGIIHIKTQPPVHVWILGKILLLFLKKNSQYNNGVRENFLCWLWNFLFRGLLFKIWSFLASLGLFVWS